LKKVETALNEEQYKRFIRVCERAHKTPYSFLKALLLRELATDVEKLKEYYKE